MDRNSEHLIVFSADLHGNEAQYRKLVSFVVSEKAKMLIIGVKLTKNGEEAENEQNSHFQRKVLKSAGK